MKFASNKQIELFRSLENCGEMVLACGPKGISVNLVGNFSVSRNSRQEDQLNVGDGTNHVHIEWDQLERVVVGNFHGEGLLTFFKGEEVLFKLYRMDGPFPNSIETLAGRLID